MDRLDAAIERINQWVERRWGRLVILSSMPKQPDIFSVDCWWDRGSRYGVDEIAACGTADLDGWASTRNIFNPRADLPALIDIVLDRADMLWGADYCYEPDECDAVDVSPVNGVSDSIAHAVAIAQGSLGINMCVGTFFPHDETIRWHVEIFKNNSRDVDIVKAYERKYEPDGVWDDNRIVVWQDENEIEKLGDRVAFVEDNQAAQRPGLAATIDAAVALAARYLCATGESGVSDVKNYLF